MIGASSVGNVTVSVTNGRGVSPEEYASMARKRIISVSTEMPEAIRSQANAFGDDIERVIAHYMRQAIKSDRTTIYNALVEAGQPELAKAILDL